MALKLKVPNLACDGCVQTITESIQTMEPDAKVEADINAKIVIVESSASEESIKQAITAAGYSIEGY